MAENTEGCAPRCEYWNDNCRQKEGSAKSSYEVSGGPDTVRLIVPVTTVSWSLHVADHVADVDLRDEGAFGNTVTVYLRQPYWCVEELMRETIHNVSPAAPSNGPIAVKGA